MHEIMVIPTDKSNGLADVRPTQDHMNGHVSFWLKSSNTGKDWDPSQRTREAMFRHGQCVPPLYGLLKYHEPENTWDPELGAPYRPVCGACLGPNASVSDRIL